MAARNMYRKEINIHEKLCIKLVIYKDHPSKCCLCLEQSVNHEESHFPVISQLLNNSSLSLSLSLSLSSEYRPFLRHPKRSQIITHVLQFLYLKQRPSPETVQLLSDICHGLFNSVTGSTTFGRHQVQFHLFQDPNERTQRSSDVQQWRQFLTRKLLLSIVS